MRANTRRALWMFLLAACRVAPVDGGGQAETPAIFLTNIERQTLKDALPAMFGSAFDAGLAWTSGATGGHFFTVGDAFARRASNDLVDVWLLEVKECAPLYSRSRVECRGVAHLMFPREVVSNLDGGAATVFGAREAMFVIRGAQEGQARSELRALEPAASGTIEVSSVRAEGFQVAWSVVTESGKTSSGSVVVRWSDDPVW